MVPPAATVDGTTITQDLLATEVDVYLAVNPADRATFEGPTPSARIQDLNRNALGFLIQQELVERYAADHGIEPDAQLTDQFVQQVVTAAGGQRQVDRQLEQRDVTQADLLAYAHQIVLRQAVAASLAPQGDAQAQGQAFGVWLVDALKKADLDVNPRFGTLDPQLGQLAPITSTDELG
jgi:hypothetical protein